MITMKEWMELVNYKITEGSDYCWECYGSNAYTLDSWNGDHKGYSFSIIFDTKDQTVYEVQAHDYLHNRAYRMVNENFAKKMKKESKRRDINKNEAWDDVNYVDLDNDDDFIQKGISIKSGEDYDTRVQVPLELPDDELFELMKIAHEKDITLNQLIEQVLQTAIDEHHLREELDDLYLKEEYDFSEGVKGAVIKS